MGRVARSGRPESISDYDDDPHELIAALRGMGAVGAIAAPIHSRAGLWGALTLGGARAEDLTDAAAARLGLFADLVGRADAALYRAKVGGRNRTCRWEADSPRDED